MTKGQIEEYSYCSKYLDQIQGWKKNIPFAVQNYGCGSHAPNIEYKLEKIHRAMFHDVMGSIKKAEDEVNKMIEEI